MKPLIILAALSITVFAAPATKVTNRQLPDGSGSSKIMDPEKKQSVETIYAKGKVSYKIVYALDERLQPLSGIYYNAAGRVFQKSAYKIDGADRIVQEVVYSPLGKLVCTKNYTYGVVRGKETVTGIDTYDSRGVLQRTTSRSPQKRR